MREPDPTHLKLKHETTRGTPTHGVHTHQTGASLTHTPHTSRSENDVKNDTATHTLSHLDFRFRARYEPQLAAGPSKV